MMPECEREPTGSVSVGEYHPIEPVVAAVRRAELNRVSTGNG
jgi:hypothetical protein